jgi:deoxycytidylate deaminase
MPDYSAMRNCTDYVGDKAKDLFNYLHGKWSTKYEVHAEMNLIFNLLKQGCNIPMDQVVIYTNISPCDQCLKNLAGLGVKEIHFNEVYWRSDPYEVYQAAKRLNINLFYKGEPFLGSV